MKIINIEKLTALRLRAVGTNDVRKGKRFQSYARKFCQVARRGCEDGTHGKDPANAKWLRYAKKACR